MCLYALEQQDMRFGFVDFVVFPTKTLRQPMLARLLIFLSRLHRRCRARTRLRTWVMPIDRHSLSCSNFSVPLEVSK